VDRDDFPESFIIQHHEKEKPWLLKTSPRCVETLPHLRRYHDFEPVIAEKRPFVEIEAVPARTSPDLILCDCDDARNWTGHGVLQALQGRTPCLAACFLPSFFTGKGGKTRTSACGDEPWGGMTT
jgi:hypothetical protein